MTDLWSTRLGTTVRRQRKLLKLTQEDLGNLAGTGLNFVSHVEKGKSTVRLDKLMALLKVLGIEIHLRCGKADISLSSELQTWS
jgi:HTH-type transcriptional regulator / antitoxin HipB